MATARLPSPIWIPRLLDLPGLLAKRSHFLFGPRQTGKTSLVRRSLKEAKVYDLLDTSVFLALSRNPGRIAEELRPRDSIVVIDEIQRLPILLNEVHRLMENRGVRFLLTGSNARKLRRGGVNLLGGRARIKNLHPLMASSKYCFFDVGVAASLQGRTFRPGTPEFGEAFETYLMHELSSFSDYMSGEGLGYWRSTSGFEVDFILGDHMGRGMQIG